MPHHFFVVWTLPWTSLPDSIRDLVVRPRLTVKITKASKFVVIVDEKNEHIAHMNFFYWLLWPSLSLFSYYTVMKGYSSASMRRCINVLRWWKQQWLATKMRWWWQIFSSTRVIRSWWQIAIRWWQITITYVHLLIRWWRLEVLSRTERLMWLGRCGGGGGGP